MRSLLLASLMLLPVVAQSPVNPNRLPPGMTIYYFGLLLRGPAWKPEVTPESAKLQEQHLGHMKKMADAGKLVLAGPFTDGGVKRGLVVYKTATLEEAKALVDADPAVQAGRLVVELHPWMTQRGVLP